MVAWPAIVYCAFVCSCMRYDAVPYGVEVGSKNRAAAVPKTVDAFLAGWLRE